MFCLLSRRSRPERRRPATRQSSELAASYRPSKAVQETTEKNLRETSLSIVSGSSIISRFCSQSSFITTKISSPLQVDITDYLQCVPVITSQLPPCFSDRTIQKTCVEPVYWDPQVPTPPVKGVVSDKKETYLVPYPAATALETGPRGVHPVLGSTCQVFSPGK